MRRTPDSMLDVLHAEGPAADNSAPLSGQFVGAWTGTVTVYPQDGTRREESCEVYFGWVLEGRAIQDVWIAPARRDRGAPGRSSQRDIYGTTWAPRNEFSLRRQAG